MECPHCGYFDGWYDGMMENIEGVDGEFFTLRIELTRNDYKFDHDKSRMLCGCPKCNKVFMGDR